MVLDEEALEAMLARGRAAERNAPPPKMVVAHKSDDFEVYERKAPVADEPPREALAAAPSGRPDPATPPAIPGSTSTASASYNDRSRAIP